MGIALLVFGVLRPQLTPASAPAQEIRSIAVLPIKNLTGDPSKAYIADGLTEVLISNLARVPSLRVPSFAAVAPFRESLDSPDLAKKLGVQLLLAGSIAEANGEVRLAIHLSDATGTAIWGDEVTRDVAGVMSAQADLSRRLAQQLALAPGAITTRKQFAARAEDAYLRGLALRVSSPTAQLDAARAFREAVELEPGFADAWAQLSLIEAAFGERALGRDREQSRALAKEMADRALALDPQLPNGLAALGTIQFYMDWDYPAAERSLRRAISSSPSASFAMQRFSMLLSALKRFDEAVDVATQSARLEPSVAIRWTTLGTVYYYARRYDEAEREMRHALSVTPDFGVAHFGLGRIAAARGNTDVAIAEIKMALAQSRTSSWLVELARTYAQAGQPDNVRAVMNELTDRQRGGDTYGIDNLAYIAAAEGRPDDALKVLQTSLEQRNAAMLWIAVDPRVDSLRNDRRFNAILQSMKLQP
jgi:TolB-like protein/lipopolysaccharide biosynthesis regulator YciM